MNHRSIKIGATEIQQVTELMLEAGGMNAMPYLPLAFVRKLGRSRVSPEITSPLTSDISTIEKFPFMEGTNEIQKNIIAT